ncbi:hypothetical protein BJ973_001121 [Actinoplanes tereljensis]|uniref:Uncharacterized protein n=1 Tax=Paractinoplanes tereljensis TaxID=571912 RepID=A0A919TYY9_9ACTN|nr:hypothetical protein Ate02nite_94040 [Actinoplanes tereljensis]
MGGLFDGFEGYRVVSESESRDALTKAHTLAPSARKHLPYWYSTQNSLGKAIAAAGFKARGVRTETETVEFVRRS